MKCIADFFYILPLSDRTTPCRDFVFHHLFPTAEHALPECFKLLTRPSLGNFVYDPGVGGNKWEFLFCHIAINSVSTGPYYRGRSCILKSLQANCTLVSTGWFSKCYFGQDNLSNIPFRSQDSAKKIYSTIKEEFCSKFYCIWISRRRFCQSNLWDVCLGWIFAIALLQIFDFLAYNAICFSVKKIHGSRKCLPYGWCQIQFQCHGHYHVLSLQHTHTCTAPAGEQQYPHSCLC